MVVTYGVTMLPVDFMAGKVASMRAEMVRFFEGMML
jgi:hypothetical protein